MSMLIKHVGINSKCLGRRSRDALRDLRDSFESFCDERSVFPVMNQPIVFMRMDAAAGPKTGSSGNVYLK
jgi:hypothetical protein